MDPLLGKLPITVLCIVIWVVLTNLDPFSATRLLVTVLGYHVQLSNLVLIKTNPHLDIRKQYRGRQTHKSYLI